MSITGRPTSFSPTKKNGSLLARSRNSKRKSGLYFPNGSADQRLINRDIANV
jgi:hypothetical protein